MARMARTTRPPLAADPTRPPMAFPAPAWSWQRVLALWIPDDHPRPKGNSKTIATDPRTGRRFVVGSKPEQHAERELVAAIRARLPEGWEPLAAAVRLDVAVDLPIPPLSQEHPLSWRVRALAGEPDAGPIEEGTADRGNLLKMIEDAARGLLYADDAQVLTGPAAKRWSTSPGWHVVVWRAVGSASARASEPAHPTPALDPLLELEA